MRLSSPGTSAASAQPTQVISTPWAEASSAARGFAAMAVRNMALVMTVP